LNLLFNRYVRDRGHLTTSTSEFETANLYRAPASLTNDNSWLPVRSQESRATMRPPPSLENKWAGAEKWGCSRKLWHVSAAIH